MDVLIDLLKTRKQWLVERILKYARELGYTEFTSPLVDVWQASVDGLSMALIAFLSAPEHRNLEISVHDVVQKDSVAGFGLLEARLHRERGIPLEMFQGLFIYYRQTYQDCVRHFLPPGDDRDRMEYTLVRLFDRMQLAFCLEWSRTDTSTLLDRMASNLRTMSNEKNRFLTFFESLAHPVVFFDTDGIIVSMNSAAAQLVRPGASMGREYYGMWSKEDLETLVGQDVVRVFPCLEDVVTAAMGSGGPDASARIVLSGNQGDRYFRVVVTREPDVSDRYAGFSLIMSEETEIYRARSLLARAKEELERTLDTLSDLVLLTDTSGRILRANRALADRLGQKIEDLIGQSCCDVLGDAECQGMPTQNSERATPVTYRNVPGHFLVSHNVVHDTEGNVYGSVTVCRDVSQMEKIMETLASVEGRYQSIFENAREGMFQLTEDGRYQSLNPAMARIFGYDSVTEMCAQETAQKLELFAHHEDEAAVIREIIESGFLASREVQMRRRDGSLFWGAIGGRLVRDAEGSIRHIEGFLQDVTERKLLESQLMQTQKLEAIGQLAAGIAHEINTPTQYVLNNMWFIKEGVEQLAEAFVAHYGLMAQVLGLPELEDEAFRLRDLDEKLQVQFYLQELPAAITETLQGLDRISAIVRSVKQFAHPGHDNMQNVDLNELIENTVTLSRNEWKYVADITTDLDPDLPAVFCLLQELGQVLLNLMINAAHAILEKGLPDGVKGVIHITTRTRDGSAEIRIQDSGTGIPETARLHIFEPFFTTKPVGKGTGQGLFMAHRTIVKNHGGSIDFESEMGSGTTFIIRLPFSGPDTEVLQA